MQKSFRECSLQGEELVKKIHNIGLDIEIDGSGIILTRRGKCVYEVESLDELEIWLNDILDFRSRFYKIRLSAIKFGTSCFSVGVLIIVGATFFDDDIYKIYFAAPGIILILISLMNTYMYLYTKHHLFIDIK
ncbi:hypothetical protein OAB00_01365 [Akkermansiaceae bacterium]|nr:hypothetical protein [Akkermansiaceae bacterium]